MTLAMILLAAASQQGMMPFTLIASVVELNSL